MKIQKKYIAGAAFALMVSLSGCGEKSGMTAGTIAESDLKTGTTQAEKENQVRPLALLAGQGAPVSWNTSESAVLPRLSCPIVKLEEAERERYPELSETLDSVMKKREQEQLRICEGLLADSSLSLIGEDDLFVQNEILETVSVRRADTRAVSLLFDSTSYLGKEERFNGIHAVTIDTQTGTELAISDVVTDLSALTEAVCGEIRTHSENAIRNLSEDSTQLEQFVAKQLESDTWVLENQGLTLYILTEETAAASENIQPVTLSFSKYPDLIKAEYQQVPESWGSEFSINRHFYADIDGDGEVNDIFISAEKTEYGDYASLNICVDQASLADEIYAFSAEPMLLCDRDGNTILFMETQSANDARMISVYDLGTGMPEKLGYAGGARCQVWNEPYECGMHQVLNNPEEFSLSTRTYLLGTYDGIRTYHMAEDGLPKAENECFQIVSYDGEEVIFTVRSPFQIDLVDEAGTVTGTTELLTGAELSYYRTDNVSFADIMLPDGQLGRLYVTANGAVLVNDMPLEEVLDGVLFAG